MADRQFQILVADDDPQVRRYFTRQLSDAGYSVITAESGATAFKILQTDPIDLLILDLSMPQPDGFELLKQLHAQKSTVKILVVSGVIQGPVLKAAEIVGATATLSKTDATTMLVPTVRSMLA